MSRTDFHFTLELFGDREVEHTFRGIGRRAQDLDPAFRSIFNQMVNIMSMNFLTRGARSGSIWEELKVETLWEKFREGSPTIDDPLMRFGNLFEAASFIPNEGNRTSYWGTGAKFELVGEEGRIGEIHQLGAPSAGIPARPFFQFTHEDREDFIAEMHHYIFRRRVRGFV